MSSPLVSIVMPVFNGSGYLREAIDSALAQTHPEVEILVVNDGSTDSGRTRDVCLSYGGRIRYFEKENGGVGDALNFAIQRMRGEYFSWLSHDDAYYPDKLAGQLRLIGQQGDPAAVCFGDYDLLNETTGEISQVRLERIFPVDWLVKSVFSVLTTVIHGCTLLIHRSHFERVGLFDVRLRGMQDHDLWFRMLRGQRNLYCPEPLVRVRLHPASGTNTMPGFAKELAQTYFHSAASLAFEEVAEMFPSPAAFYHRIAGLVLGYGQPELAKRLLTKAAVLPPENDAERKRERLRIFLEKLAGGKKRELYIFGLGLYGRRLLWDLAARGMEVTGFLDNNSAKWNTTFQGLPCLAPDELAPGRRQTALVISAARDPDAMVGQLRQLGVRHVASKQDLDATMLETPPAVFRL